MIKKLKIYADKAGRGTVPLKKIIGTSGPCATQCEEDESWQTQVAEIKARIRSVPLRRRGANVGVVQKAARGLGLCANCSHRRNCIFPGVRRGVQSCEEYQ